MNTFSQALFSLVTQSRKECSFTPPPSTFHLLVKAQVPMSIFFAGPVGEMSKSKMSMGRPRVVHAFGIWQKEKGKVVSQSGGALPRLELQLCEGIRGGGEENRTHIHNARNMPLHRRTTKQQIDLIIIIAKASEIFNHSQRGLAIRDRGIHVVLLAVLVDAEALEGEVAAGAELGLDGTLVEDRGFHAQVGHAVLHHAEFERDDAGHFDGAAEGDFAVAFWRVGMGSQGRWLSEGRWG
jgi:hypothetical protein